MAVPEEYAFDIHTLLAESQPQSLLIIGVGADALVSDYVEQTAFLRRACEIHSINSGHILSKLKGLGRFDTGIVVNTIEHMDKRSAGRLIASLRDVHTPQFCVVVPIGDDWPSHASVWETGDLLGFGLTLVNSYGADSGPVHLYKYDIATYKNTPDWLNANNWANPELWDKYRW